MRALAVLFMLLAISSIANAVEWVQVSSSEAAGSAYRILADPAHERLILGGTGGGGVSGYRVYYPLTDEWLIREGSGLGSVTAMLTHPTDPLFLLTARYGSFWNGWIKDNYGLTTDGPDVLTGAIGAILGIDRLPSQVDVLFACAMTGEGDPGGIYCSIDAGQTWSHSHSFYPSEATALAITPDNDLLVGLGYPVGIARGIDAGEAWTDATGDMPLAAEGHISAVLVDPTDAQHVYAAQTRFFYESWDPAHGVYETMDGGQHWEQIFMADMRDLCMDPTNANVLVALFDTGIVLTRNGGGTWVDIRGNVTWGKSCAISPTDDRIYVAAGDGLWATDASPTAVESAPAAGLALAAHPNPFNPKTTLSFSLREAGAVNLRILDAQGRQVRALLAAAARPAGPRVAHLGRPRRGRPRPAERRLLRAP